MQDRWIEFISEIFDNPRKDYSIMKGNFAILFIMKDEIWAAVRKMKLVKTTGSDSITVELLKAVEVDGNDKITRLLNKMYDICQIPQVISKSIFITLLKKPGETASESHRMISNLSHTIKFL